MDDRGHVGLFKERENSPTVFQEFNGALSPLPQKNGILYANALFRVGWNLGALRRTVSASCRRVSCFDFTGGIQVIHSGKRLHPLPLNVCNPGLYISFLYI